MDELVLREPASPLNPSAEIPVRESVLPDQPLVTIDANRLPFALNLRELWHFRDLLYFLTWRDLRIRYKQTVLGAGWAILQPLITMLVFVLFFRRLVGGDIDGIPYPLYTFAALLPWTFFSNAVISSGNSLIGNAGLITKVYFPRVIIPAAAIAARLVDFAIAFAFLLALMMYYGRGIGPHILILPIVILLVTVLSLAVGLIMSALNVRYRDIGFLLPFLIQLSMFASPIFYPARVIPDEWRWLYGLNPLNGVIEGFRAALFGIHNTWSEIAIASVVTVLLFLAAIYVFQKTGNTFADVV